MLPWFGDFFGPMFHKEMTELARRPRYYFTRVLLTGVLFIIFCTVWYGTMESRRQTSISLMANFSRRLFYGVMWAEFVAALLLTPLFLFSVIAEERDRNTLDLVFTTDLLDREIILGKFASRICVLGLLVLGGLPILALCALFGGISFPSLFYGSLVTLSAVLFCGSVTLYYSTISGSPLGAILRSFATLFCLLLLLPLSVGIFGELMRFISSDTVSWLMSIQSFVNPIFIFYTSMGDRFVDQKLRSTIGENYFSFSIATQTLLAVFFIWRAIGRLRPKEEHAKKNRTSWFWNKQPIAGSGSVQDAPVDKKKVQRGIPRWPERFFGLKISNPIWLRHRLALPYDRDGYFFKTQRLAIILWSLFILMILCFGRSSFGGFASPYVAFGWMFALVFTVLVGGFSFNSDRRRGALDMILQTTLEPDEVIDGTLRGVLEYPRWSFFACLSLTFLGGFAGWFYLRGAILSAVTAMFFIVICALAAVGSSLSAKSPLSAMAGALFLPMFEIIGLPMLTLSVGGEHGKVYLVLFPIAAFVFWLRYRSTFDGWIFGLFTTFLHLGLCSILFLWAGVERNTDRYTRTYPMELSHSGFMVIVPLEKSRWTADYTYRSSDINDDDIAEKPRWFNGSGPWWLAHPTYWLATAAAFWISRRLLISKFDAICDRPG